MKYMISYIAFLLIFSSANAQMNNSNNANSKNQKMSIGVGLGLEYAMKGFNAEYEFNQFSALISLGKSPNRDFSYNIGSIYYFNANSKIYRPRLVVLYGTNKYSKQIILPYRNPSMKIQARQYHGLTLGIGQELMFGEKSNIGLTFDLNYATSKRYDKAYTEIMKEVKINNNNVDEYNRNLNLDFNLEGLLFGLILWKEHTYYRKSSDLRLSLGMKIKF